MSVSDPSDPLRMMTIPNRAEAFDEVQSQKDPLGERRNQVGPRLIHRYSDRVLLWVTDTCGVYCRYCTRKHFTAQGLAAAKSDELEQAIGYIKDHKGIREVILSGGDPLTVSDEHLDTLMTRLREIEHIEILRIGSRMIVANPYRVTDRLVHILKAHQPVVFMSHFNHPKELTLEAYEALSRLVDGGIPVFNQMVLLNGVNNHPAIVHALSRKLLLARVKPYYMFQCDPSQGTDHLRTSVEQSLAIQKELWGHVSGLAMPNLALDIPSGGGKAAYVPNFEIEKTGDTRKFKGWDGVEAEYISPPMTNMKVPSDADVYLQEWQSIIESKS
jgi:lysine 2,3-aminomutase